MNFSKNIQLLGMVFGMLVLIPSCSLFEQQGGTAKAPAFVIVNVLDKEYYDDCHIQGSINVPFEQIESYAQSHWDKDTTEIVVHCTNYKCTASAAAWQKLHALGFKHVFAYEGGTAEARQVGIPVEGPCKETYLNDFAKPTTQQSTAEEPAVVIISAQELKKKIEEFAMKT